MSSEKVCFIISPIGEPDTDVRRLADEKYDLIFEPILDELGYTPIRSDKESSSSSISRTIVTRLINSELVIADTSGFNANVFYELAIRNASKKPVIIIKEPEQKLPFDVYDKRAISVDMKNNRQWTNAKEELKQHILNAAKDPKSASESILSEYTFDLGVSKSPNTEQETFLMIKDLKDELRNMRNDYQKNRSMMSREMLVRDTLESSKRKIKLEGVNFDPDYKSLTILLETENIEKGEEITIQFSSPNNDIVFISKKIKFSHDDSFGWRLSTKEIGWKGSGTYTAIVTTRDGIMDAISFKYGSDKVSK